MPYNTDVTDIRRLTALGTLTQDFTDPMLVEEQEAAKDIIDAKTGRQDWSAIDPQWELIQRIENLLAGAFVLGHGGPSSKDESERLWLRGMQLLELVATTMTGTAGADADLLFSASKYLSYPLGLEDDETTQPHQSTRRDVLY